MAKDTIIYRCSDCQKTGVKLWRPYGDQHPLRCATCTLVSAGYPADTPIDPVTGRNKLSGYGTGWSSDAIGWHVPAVPTAEGDEFWGYTSVPPDRVEWWRNLPL